MSLSSQLFCRSVSNLSVHVCLLPNGNGRRREVSDRKSECACADSVSASGGGGVQLISRPSMELPRLCLSFALFARSLHPLPYPYSPLRNGSLGVRGGSCCSVLWGSVSEMGKVGVHLRFTRHLLCLSSPLAPCPGEERDSPGIRPHTR